MKIPKSISQLIESFQRLPGVGPKTAQRLTFYLLHVPQEKLDSFAKAIEGLKKGTLLCSICFSIDEVDPCSICSDTLRDHSTICVVEEPLDLLALEKSGKYKGIYHVLHGKIDPLNNIGPEEIYVGQLLQRVESSFLRHPELVSGSLQEDSGSKAGMTSEIKEIILATNPTMEGEATAMYVSKNLKSLASLRSGQNPNLKITRIGRGLPIGADIEYADDITLQRAMEGRQEF